MHYSSILLAGLISAAVAAPGLPGTSKPRTYNLNHALHRRADSNDALDTNYCLCVGSDENDHANHDKQTENVCNQKTSGTYQVTGQEGGYKFGVCFSDKFKVADYKKWNKWCDAAGQPTNLKLKGYCCVGTTTTFIDCSDGTHGCPGDEKAC